MSEKAVQIACKWLQDADAFLVTASNGLSISEGLNIFAHDHKLEKVTGCLDDRYSFRNILSTLQFDFPNRLDQWKAYVQIIEHYGNNYQPSYYMKSLKKIIGNRSTFIWTSNIDHHFKLAGFHNVFEMEGNWFEAVCSKHPKGHPIYHLASKSHDIYEKDRLGTLKKAAC